MGTNSPQNTNKPSTNQPTTPPRPNPPKKWAHASPSSTSPPIRPRARSRPRASPCARPGLPYPSAASLRAATRSSVASMIGLAAAAGRAGGRGCAGRGGGRRLGTRGGGWFLLRGGVGGGKGGRTRGCFLMLGVGVSVFRCWRLERICFFVGGWREYASVLGV